MGESLKKRDEIRLEDTWDLGAMMPSDPVSYTDLKEAYV